jgi:hypothetical protein
MNATIKPPAEFSPETRFAVLPVATAPFRATLETEFERRKSRLLAKTLAEADQPELTAPRNGVVGRRFVKRQMLLHLPSKANLPEEGDETGQPPEGRNRLGRFSQNQLGFPKERGNFRAGRFVQGR